MNRDPIFHDDKEKKYNPVMEVLSITKAIIAFALAYLIGSIPMGYIVAALSGQIDIREHGSGNIGLTNVIRTLGWGPGLLTGALDFLKGYMPVFIVENSFSPDDFGTVAVIYELTVIVVAFLIILGNMFPVYLLFKGGKGVATGLGVLSALLGVFVFIPVAIFGIFLLLMRYVSVASIAAALSAPLTVLIFKSHIPFTSDTSSSSHILFSFTLLLGLLVTYRHIPNIHRVMNGTEPRVGTSKTSSFKSRFKFGESHAPEIPVDIENLEPQAAKVEIQGDEEI